MKRPKKSVREWFTATLRGDVLTPARGCTRIVVTIGDKIDETCTREPHRQLTANVGDKLLLCGASTGEIQIAIVRAIQVEGWKARLFLTPSFGAVNDGPVQVMKTKLGSVAKARAA